MGIDELLAAQIGAALADKEHFVEYCRAGMAQMPEARRRRDRDQGHGQSGVRSRPLRQKRRRGRAVEGGFDGKLAREGIHANNPAPAAEGQSSPQRPRPSKGTEAAQAATGCLVQSDCSLGPDRSPDADPAAARRPEPRSLRGKEPDQCRIRPTKPIPSAIGASAPPAPTFR